MKRINVKMTNSLETQYIFLKVDCCKESDLVLRLHEERGCFDFCPCVIVYFQVVFGSIVLLMLWLPIRIIKLLFPTFLPYNVMLYRYTQQHRRAKDDQS